MVYFHHFAHELAFLAFFRIFRAKTLSKIVKNTISENLEILDFSVRITENPVISEREDSEPAESRFEIVCRTKHV